MALNSHSERSIALCGFTGAGKSRLGDAFARRHGLRLIDLDMETERNTGLTIPEMFEKYSEMGFRALERESLLRVLRRDFEILALGGGSLSFADNLERVKDRCALVWIDTPLDLIMGRIEKQHSGERPVITLYSRESLKELYRARIDQYSCSEYRIDGSKHPDELLSILNGIAGQTGILASEMGEHDG